MTGAASKMDASRAVQIVTIDGAGRRWFASGYLVAADLVLTADHAVRDRDLAASMRFLDVSVRFVDAPGRTRDVPAEVVFADPNPWADVAVLRLNKAEPAVNPVAFGYPGGPMTCQAVGFPRFKLNDDHRAATALGGPDSRGLYRDSHHAIGSVTPNSNRYAGTLELTVRAPDRDPGPDHSPWEGMSGAAVFADDVLIGVVAEHHRREGLSRLTASAVRQWRDLLDAPSWQKLDNLLGLSGGRLCVAGDPAVSSGVVRALPRDIPAFTGRADELARLESTLNDAGGGVLAVHAVDGMAGVGKSAFAIHAAHHLADRFPDGHMFLALRGHTPGQTPLSVPAALDALLAYDGLSPAMLPETVEGKQALWRTRTAGRQQLLVLDDAIDADQVTPLLPADPRTLVLVTSRRRLIGLDGAVPLSLDVLDPMQAAALLVLTAARPDLDASDADIQMLADLCGYLPLALTLIGALLAHHRTWAAADLIADFRQADNRLKVLDSAGRSVAAALRLSYRDLDPEEQQLFVLLGAHPGTEYDTPAAASLLDTDASTAQRLLTGLEEHRLLLETAIRGRYRMHDLTREHAAALATESGPDHTGAALQRLYEHYQNPSLDDTHSRTTLQRSDRERMLAWARTERANLLACIRQADRHHHDQTVIALTIAVARPLEADGSWDDAISLHSRAASLARNTEDVGLAKSLNNLGRVQRLNGHYEAAIRNHARALELYERLRDRRGEAETLIFQGWAIYVTDDYLDAGLLYERALDLYRQLDDHLGEADALDNLGRIRRAGGDDVGALPYHSDALELYRQVGDRIGQANALNSRGRAQLMVGDHAGARQDQSDALELYELLDNCHGQANALNDLGKVLLTTGDFTAAIDSHTRALALYRQLEHRLGQADALYNLSRSRSMADDYAGAGLDQAYALELSPIELNILDRERWMAGDYAGPRYTRKLRHELKLHRDRDRKLSPPLPIRTSPRFGEY